MTSKEQIAHDLTMIYMKNRYGINVSGNFYINDDFEGNDDDCLSFDKNSDDDDDFDDNDDDCYDAAAD